MNNGVNGQHSQYPDPYGSDQDSQNNPYNGGGSGQPQQPGHPNQNYPHGAAQPQAQPQQQSQAQWQQDPRGPQQQYQDQAQAQAQNQYRTEGQNQYAQQQGASPMDGQEVVPEQPYANTQVKEKKRWSTPAVAALLLAGAIAASATTAVVMEKTGDGPLISENATTSFDSNNRPQGEQASTPVEPGSIADISQRVLPSVVSIKVQTRRSAGEGSGSIFSSDGLIVTNNHVVGDAADGGRIQVLLNDGRQLNATVVATDPQTDIAVIKAEGATDLKPIELGDSDALNVGEDVLAVGSPLGLAATVTSGIVSAKNRPVQASGERGGEASLIDAIQTDAAINPGNSGGALVNMEGKLVGIPSVIATMGGSSGQQSGSIGLGFAIPINQAQRIVQELIDNGKAEHPIIGAQVDTSSEDTIGAPIVEVNSGSPAEEAGLKRGDIVTKVNDRPVDSGVGLIAAIRSHKVGDTITLTVKEGDNGPERQVEVTLAAE